MSVQFAVSFYLLTTTKEPLNGYSAIGRRHLTAEARVQSQVSPREIFGRQNCTGADYSPSNWFASVSVISPVHRTYLSVTDAM